MVNEQLIYKLADTLQTDLFEVNGDIRGLVRSYQVEIEGLWKTKSDIVICVDENTDKMLSAFIRVVGNLWAYFMATEEGCWMLFFSGAEAKISVGAEGRFGTKKAHEAVLKLKPFFKRAFFRTSDKAIKDRPWTALNLATVLE